MNTYVTKGESATFVRDAFIRDYATQFIASWAAKHFEDYCARGLHHELEHPPWEDALFLAEQAWDHLIKITP